MDRQKILLTNACSRDKKKHVLFVSSSNHRTILKTNPQTVTPYRANLSQSKVQLRTNTQFKHRIMRDTKMPCPHLLTGPPRGRTRSAMDSSHSVLVLRFDIDMTFLDQEATDAETAVPRGEQQTCGVVASFLLQNARWGKKSENILKTSCS